MQRRRLGKALGVLLAVAATLAAPAGAAQAYNPLGGVMYSLGSEPCLKGRGNCAVYPKSAQLPSGRLVAAFEKATVVPASGGAAGETLPVYSSDDYGTTWKPLSEVKAPAYLSGAPELAKYTSNWTNPYLYVLPQDVGSLKSGTLLLASVVSGEDYYYQEHKAADPNWVPSNDGDRKDLAIALFSSTDQGVTWNVVNVVATGGWQGGSAGAVGQNVAAANTAQQVDPLWEPYLMVRDGKLVCYYSDENDYLGFDPATGVPQLDPANDTATDSHGQILVHKTWTGSGAWSAPIVDVAGDDQSMGGGKTEIGGGRPGMTTVVPTTDNKWLITYEYWGGGENVRYKLAADPLKFYADGDRAGTAVSGLALDPGSRSMATGGSPVLIQLPDGRLAYNAAGSGNIWVNTSGRSDGAWTEYQTMVGPGYSRNLQYVKGTGRVVILRNQGTSQIAFGEVDLGRSDGAYYQLVNRKTGQVIGTGNKTNDANIGNHDTPDIALEAAGAPADKDTQYWHLMTKPGGGVTLLNKSGGRAAAVWGGNPTDGQRIAQWVDDTAGGVFTLVPTTDGYTRLQAAKNTNVFLTGAAAGAPLTVQNAATDGSQDWQLVRQAPAAADLTPGTQSAGLIGADPVGTKATVPLDVTAVDPTGKALHADTPGQVYLVAGDGTVTDLGAVTFDAAQHGTVTLPGTLTPGTAFRIAVAFEDTPLMWDAATVRSSVPVPTAPAAPAAPTVAVSHADLKVTWTAPANGGSPITGYRVTLTRDGRKQPARTVAASTTTTFAKLKPGKYRATVVAVNAVGASAPSAASAEAKISTAAAVKITVKSRCGSGGVRIDVYVVNKSGQKADVTVKTPYGTRKFVGVGKGKSVHRVFDSGRKKIAAGKVTVDVSFVAGGVAYRSTYTARYAAAKCKRK